MHHEEDVLDCVLHRRVRHAQTAQIPPNEADVLIVNLGECRPARHRRELLVPGQRRALDHVKIVRR
jgi:hypothetical protein